MGQDERPLSGGRTTAGVVRIGATVRRPAQANSEFVRRLLRHLEAAGFAGAPRVLGVDKEGREIFSFIPGEVPVELGRHSDSTLQAAARLIRSYHDATVSFVRVLAAADGMEVVCHNDLSPCNCVFQNGRPTALIDFDAAAPGSRNEDLGYAAWLWLDLGDPEISGEEQRRRLLVFMEAYGGELNYAAIRNSILSRQEMLAAAGHQNGREAMTSWARKCRDWTLQHL